MVGKTPPSNVIKQRVFIVGFSPLSSSLHVQRRKVGGSTKMASGAAHFRDIRGAIWGGRGFFECRMVPWEIEGEISARQLELHPIGKINVDVSRRLMFHMLSSLGRKQRAHNRAYNFAQQGV